MRFVALNTIILIAACALSTGATAQKTYKCGNSYSQLPCPDGEVIDTADPRTPEQKSQADAATRRDALAADALEKSRLEQEKRALAARPPPPPPAAPSANEISPPQIIYIRKKKPSRHGPKDFTALVPDERKRPAKKPHSRKSGAS
ncbi:MAG: DUF4124 domain-containing protein [Rhodoferax sp.]|jgi:hypothetical protein|nr:DUF4124 domain-containing protein [Rhodoferax sp.]MBP9684445.1 DUF4124 domain-containing protein [Rhodoferax sp.]